MAHASVLVLFAHPDRRRSVANRPVVDALEQLDGVTVHDLYEAYPDFHIDVPTERAACEAHDVLLFVHPIYWYSWPALLKLWFESVFRAGWAFGPDGDALRGKRMLAVVSTGADEQAYSPGGVHGRPVGDFLLPYAHTARFCGMTWLEPVVLHDARKAARERLAGHVDTILERVRGLLAGPAHDPGG